MRFGVGLALVLALGMILNENAMGNHNKYLTTYYNRWWVRGHILHKGMTKAEIRKLCGEPYYETPTVWRYKQKMAASTAISFLVPVMPSLEDQISNGLARDLHFSGDRLAWIRPTFVSMGFPAKQDMYPAPQ